MRNKLGAKTNGIMQPDLDRAICVLSLRARPEVWPLCVFQNKKKPSIKTRVPKVTNTGGSGQSLRERGNFCIRVDGQGGCWCNPMQGSTYSPREQCWQ